MKRITVLAIAALLSSFVPGTGPALAQSAGPYVRAGATEKLSEHVHVIPDASAPGVPNVGFVIGSSSVLVIDTGMGAANGETVLAEARKIAPGRKILIVTTHVHPEHDLGAQAFPSDAQMIRSAAQVKEIAEAGMRTADVFRERSETNRKLLDGAHFRKADVVFTGTYELDLGGLKVHLLTAGPSHTPGDTAIWVPADGVLFSGDLAMSALPAFASPESSVKHWLAALDMLNALHPRIIVPSHGPLGDVSYISAYRTYLTRIQGRAGALRESGQTLEEATAAITAELGADYPNTTRAAGAIRSAYAEAK